MFQLVHTADVSGREQGRLLSAAVAGTLKQLSGASLHGESEL